MSLLYKRPGSPYWYVTKTRESTKTVNRKLAEEYARKALTEHWRSEALGEQTRTWEELAEDWLDAKDGQASYDQDRMVIERFTALLKRRDVAALADIDGELIAQYGKTVKAETSAATANRHFTTIRAMLNYAHGKDWIHKVPRIDNYALPVKEKRWVSLEQFETIASHLPEWVADMAIVAVQTGMRFSNVAGLRWDWITADGNIAVVPAVVTKTGRTYTVPLSSTAKKILAKRLEIQRQSSAFREYVFVGKKQAAPGKFAEPVLIEYAPVDSVRHWWESATEKAGFPGLRWHDLRHTWASLMTQNGVPDRVLAAAGGWASTRMLDVYAHLSTKHLTEFADYVNGKPEARSSP